jgi:hypothetical protein
MTKWLCLTALVLGACGNSNGNAITGDDDDDAQMGSDGGHEPTPVPLVVATGEGLVIWHDSLSLSSSIVPDVVVSTNSLDNGATAVTATANHVFVGRASKPVVPPGNETTAAVLVYGGAATLTAASTAAASVATSSVSELRVDGADNLWVDDAEAAGTVLRYASASTLGSTATATATFAHPNGQLPSFAVEPTSQRLFAGQISGTGVIAWNDAMTATGSPPDDFTLGLGAYWRMRVDTDHDRMYAVGQHMGGGAGLAIWPNASTLGNSTPPLLVAKGYTAGDFISDCAVRDDVVVVVARDQKAVMIYTHASAITADRAPDFTITDHLIAPTRAVLDSHDRLYIADTGGVLIFSSISTAPTFITQVSVAATGTSGTAKPNDLTLAEP